MIDISNPDHEEALREAIDRMRKNRWSKVPPYLRGMAAAAKAPPLKLAYQAFLDPKKAADLIRQLIERAGGKVYAYGVSPGESGHPYVTIATGDGEPRVLFPMDQMANAAARLLRLVPNAGPQAALDALRGGP